jgi:hypothetical protein
MVYVTYALLFIVSGRYLSIILLLLPSAIREKTSGEGRTCGYEFVSKPKSKRPPGRPGVFGKKILSRLSSFRINYLQRL